MNAKPVLKLASSTIAIIALSIAWLVAIAAPNNNLLEMSEQLDRVEKLDFDSAVSKANACTRARDFQCTDAQLRIAGKLANGERDRSNLNSAKTALSSEKLKVAAEARARAEEERRVVEAEERQRVAQEEAEQRARQDAADRERQMAANNSSYSPPQRNSSPFDGLNSINQVMRNGQAQIAAAQAARAGTRNTETVMRAAEAQERYAALSRPTVSSESRSQQTSPSSSRNAVQDTSDRPSPAAQRTACVNEEKYSSNDYSELTARAFLQKKIDGAKASTETMVNDPYRYLGDSGITCHKEATTINPEYKCSVTIKSEVKHYGACGNSRPSTAGISK